ncbi:monooxygenase 1-like [Nicotiana tabacum]|uniref:FAD-dependent urate hydroxylase-like n=3 Tax=Nicotiana TaxID=4085 RepID=A0A1S4BPG5_TOBAC|nr:PREDICTED: zeaxanthin epoxidase, chloroplastic-like [Nicotiana sylvestris]XP_016490728.1 PREDICTED: FAD-dependent urate hydroxylase-like [Nicotiana tabacum]
MESAGCEEMHEIVIVGGGLCGLATALALHKKGIKSVVLEKSETLRAAGAAIGVMPNGWRALDQLGVGSHLRSTALPLQGTRMTWIDKGKEQYTPNKNIGEVRCLKRSDIVETFADALPRKTIRFGCEIASVEMDPLTSLPCILLSNGKRIGAKILIGCDGSRSVVSSFLGVKPTRTFRISAIRGLTSYPNGHSFPLEFVRLISDKTAVGRLPITDMLVHWFIGVQQGTDTIFPHDPELIKQRALEATSGRPADVQEMIEGCDLDSLSFTHLRYRAPWDLMLGNFREKTVTVAGDAMHVMGPFLGQGGSAGIEDAVVLARNLAKTLKGGFDHEKVGEALDQYVKERRMRVVKLATQSYLTALLVENTPLLIKFVVIAVMALFFRNPSAHVLYDCGHL